MRKTYFILSAQLMLTFGFVVIMKLSTPVNDAIMDAWYLFLPCMIVQLVIWCTLLCCIKVARKTPGNYILLGLFTLCWTFILGYICSFYDTQDVAVAMCMTAIVTVTLSAYACFTTTDFTKMCGPFLCWGLLLVICVQMILSIICMLVFEYTDTYIPFVEGFCVILYGLYLLIDTQLIVGGGRYKLTIDDYIIGAIIIYMDIIMIFLYLLQMFGGR